MEREELMWLAIAKTDKAIIQSRLRLFAIIASKQRKSLSRH